MKTPSPTDPFTCSHAPGRGKEIRVPVTKKPVWETTHSKTFRDPDKVMRNLDKEVNDLVSKSFEDFPPNSPR